MPISGSIYRQPPIQIPSPAEFLKGITDIREAERTERAATQAEQDAATVRQVMSSTGGDVDATIKKLREVGAFGAADVIEKSDMARRKARADILKTQLENKTASDATVSGYVYAALDDPTPASIDRLKQQLATVPMSPDDPPGSRAKLLDQLATFDPVETPKLLQSWADGLLTEKQQDEKNREHLKLLYGDNPIRGMAGLLAQTTDPADYADEYGSLLSTVHDRDTRSALRAKFLDPSKVTPENFAAVKQELENLSTTETEKTNRMNAETAAANAARQSGFTLSQGQTRYDAQGNKIASVAPRPVAQSGGSGGGSDKLSPSDQALVEAIIKNPGLYDKLTPTTIGRIAGELDKRGFSMGQPLTNTAITHIAETESAIKSLQDLRGVLQANESYIGPIAGLQALNPWSDARKAQANIDLVRQRVGKALEGGVLRKEDEEKYKKILATLTDTPSTAIYKVDQLIANIQQNIQTYKDEQRLAGKRVGTDEKHDEPSVTASELEKIAKRRGTTVEQERARATAAGYVIR